MRRSEPLACFTSSGINRDFDSFSDDSSAQSSPRYPLAHKPMVVVATKIDSANPDKLKKLAAHAKRRKLDFFAISAVTGQGIEELKWALAARVRPDDEA